jgi:hypothetical protein
MKFTTFVLCVFFHLNKSIILADSNVSAFNHWDVVAAVSVDNKGTVTTSVLHCSDRIRKDFVSEDFHKEVEKWAGKMKMISLVYAMKIQDSKKKSATWKISNNTFKELHKISEIMRAAKIDMKADIFPLRHERQK